MPTFEVPLYSDGDWDRIIEAQVDLARASTDLTTALQRDTSPLREGDAAGVDGLRQQVADAEKAKDDLIDQAAARAVAVRGKSIGRRRFRTLRQAHPPRWITDPAPDPTSDEPTGKIVHPEDARRGVNMDTFPVALLGYVDPDDPEIRTITEPRKSAHDLVGWLDDELSEGEVNRLFNEAWDVNAGGPADPKLLRSFVPPATYDTN
ncbi:hypothetical protein [Nocardioides marmoraquaticus]